MNSSFQCWFCEENLENCRYVIHENFALCFQCFDKNYAHKCVECKQCIGIETSVRLKLRFTELFNAACKRFLFFWGNYFSRSNLA